MGMLAGQMTSLKSDVVQRSMSGTQVQQHDQRIGEFERQLKDSRAERSTGSGAASSAVSSEHPILSLRGDPEPCIFPTNNAQCLWWEVLPTTRRGMPFGAFDQNGSTARNESNLYAENMERLRNLKRTGIEMSGSGMMCVPPYEYMGPPCEYVQSSSDTSDTEVEENHNTWNALLEVLTMPGSSDTAGLI